MACRCAGDPSAVGGRDAREREPVPGRGSPRGECELGRVRGVREAAEYDRPGLRARLPTEAEWEHACRAGTHASTWLGDVEIRGENDAPLLDPIAWYGGNCGIDSARETGKWADTSKWPQKQHQHTMGGTHPVRRKEANPFGLYDMLGNVWEWCLDCAEFPLERSAVNVIDPSPNRVGSNRVLRGGSWPSSAGGVRAARRDALATFDRFNYLGLRLARGQEPGQGAGPGAAP